MMKKIISMIAFVVESAIGNDDVCRMAVNLGLLSRLLLRSDHNER